MLPTTIRLPHECCNVFTRVRSAPTSTHRQINIRLKMENTLLWLRSLCVYFFLMFVPKSWCLVSKNRIAMEISKWEFNLLAETADFTLDQKTKLHVFCRINNFALIALFVKGNDNACGASSTSIATCVCLRYKILLTIVISTKKEN